MTETIPQAVKGRIRVLFVLPQRDFFYLDAPTGFTVSAKSVGKRLSNHINNVVRSDGHILTLHSTSKQGSLTYRVEAQEETTAVPF